MTEQKDSSATRPLLDAAWSRFEEGAGEEALALFRRIVEDNPEDEDACSALGVSCAFLGRREAAVTAFARQEALLARVMEHFPNDWRARHRREAVLLRLGRPKEALALWNEGDVVSPEKGCWYMNGIILAVLGRHSEAITAFRRGLAMFPGWNEIWPYLGYSLYALRRMEEALAWYSLSDGFSNGIELNGKGAALFRLGRFDEALVAFAKVLDGPFDLIHGRIWRNQGIVLRELQRHEEAEAALMRAEAWERNTPPDCADILIIPPVISLEEV